MPARKGKPPPRAQLRDCCYISALQRPGWLEVWTRKGLLQVSQLLHSCSHQTCSHTSAPAPFAHTSHPDSPTPATQHPVSDSGRSGTTATNYAVNNGSEVSPLKSPLCLALFFAASLPLEPYENRLVLPESENRAAAQ